MIPDLRSLMLLAVLALVVLVVRRIPLADFAGFSRLSGGARLPLAAGILAASITLWQWGGLRASPVVHDESAYLLQAELLATGHWSRPSPPGFVAFTQPAVLVTPVLAPKMPPGHALLLVPGVLLHIPGLVPILLVGITAALLAILVRRFAGAGAAAIAVALWLTQAAQGRWRGSYFSQNTTTVCWLVGWWALLRWRETGRGRWLLVVAGMTGWGAITRPLTMVAFAIPVAIIVIRDTIRHGRWPQLGRALIFGTAILSLMLVQAHAITGKWNQTALGLYTRQYLPFDKLGFGYDATPPLLELPAVYAAANVGFEARHREHTLGALPGILAARLRVWVASNFSLWRRFLIPLAFLGLFLLPRGAWLGVVTTALLYLLYLGYAHEPYWSAYYAEATPVAAGVIALGAAWLINCTLDPGPRAELAQLLVAVVIVVWAAPDLARWGRASRESQQPYRAFSRQLATLPPQRSLVFVHVAPDHDPHLSLVQNVADPVNAPVIVALDLGDPSRAIVRAGFPTRRAYIWDEASGRLMEDAP